MWLIDTEKSNIDLLAIGIGHDVKQGIMIMRLKSQTCMIWEM